MWKTWPQSSDFQDLIVEEGKKERKTEKNQQTGLKGDQLMQTHDYT